MPRIESTIDISASLERVWELAGRVEEFPEFMPDLKSLKVLERSDDGLRTVTEWVGIVREFNTTVKWVEEDIWDPSSHQCQFKMIKGDYKQYEGTWSFQEVDDKVRFHSVIDFEYDVPLIGALIKNLVANKMKQNAENVLRSIKAKAEEE